MKVGVAKASQLGKCWLPARFLDGCRDCQHLCPKENSKVRKCNLPEAKKARVPFLRTELHFLKAQYTLKRLELRDALAKSVDELGGKGEE